MDEFLKISQEEQEELIRETANRLSLHPTPVEKDFWVCLLLRELFALPETGSHLLFKGGTSLSKAYHAISRFSEDIDVSIDRSVLGFSESDDWRTWTKSQRDNRLKKLYKSTGKWIRETLAPVLKKNLERLIPSKGWNLEFQNETHERLHIFFHYPSSLKSQYQLNYAKPYVLIEFSARADHEPTEHKQIQSYIAENFPEIIPNAEISVKVLAAVRTFWEKVTILHAESSRPKGDSYPPRLARHAYDIWQLMQSGIGEEAMENPDLLKRVCDHKSVFFRQKRVDYQSAYSGRLSIVPNQERQVELGKDYREMREFFLKQPPPFESIIEILKEIETRINQ